MEETEFERYERELREQQQQVARDEALQGELLDRQLKIVPDDDFFDEDYVGEDGIYVPPLDKHSPKMKEIWAPDDPNERTDQAVTLDGDYQVVSEPQGLLIEHDGEDDA